MPFCVINKFYSEARCLGCCWNSFRPYSSWPLFLCFLTLRAFSSLGNLNLAFAWKPQLSKASCIFERIFGIIGVFRGSNL